MGRPLLIIAEDIEGEGLFAFIRRIAAILIRLLLPATQI